MHKKLTITLEEDIYTKLHKIIRPRQISQFIENLLRPHIISKSLESAYAEMAKDEKREREALDWSESLIVS